MQSRRDALSTLGSLAIWSFCQLAVSRRAAVEPLHGQEPSKSGRIYLDIGDGVRGEMRASRLSEGDAYRQFG